MEKLYEVDYFLMGALLGMASTATCLPLYTFLVDSYTTMEGSRRLALIGAACLMCPAGVLMVTPCYTLLKCLHRPPSNPFFLNVARARLTGRFVGCLTGIIFGISLCSLV